MKYPYKTFGTAVLTAFVLGAIAGSFFVRIKTDSVLATAKPSLRLKGGLLTRPLLLSDVPSNTDSPELSALHSTLQDIVSDAQEKHDIATASVYVRSIDTGLQTVINGSEKYFPASLTKIPLMMTYFKLAQTDGALLTERGRLDFQADANIGMEILPERTPVSGHEYSRDELIEMMIEDSDNTSFSLLINNDAAQEHMKALFDDFQLPYFFDQPPADVITVQEFSRFIRALYNATYLDIGFSEKALNLMAKTNFERGITAGVPKNVQVAHKYGLNTEKDAAGTVTSRQLHDCGVVYCPRNPYLLCVMTKSSADLSKIEGVIQKISRAVYEAMDKQ